MRRITRGRLILLAALLVPAALAAQVPPALVQGFDLERVGRNTEAAERFRAVLSQDPANVPALLGLERVLTPLGQLDSALGPLRAALAKQPNSRMIRAIELRVWAGLGKPDSVTAAARRWLQVDSLSTEVYREWSYALAQRGDVRGAQGVLQQGLDRLGGDALLVELAQMSGTAGAWSDAARQWRQAIDHNPSLESAATINLDHAPGPFRDDVLGALVRPPLDSGARRVAADLSLSWDRAGEAWPLLDSALPGGAPGVPVLQRFADRAHASPR